MKSIAANALLGEAARHRERLGEIRLGAMEGRVKAGDLRNLRRSVHDRANWGEVVRLMQRGEGLQLDEVIEHGLGHPDGSVIVDAAVDHPVAESGHGPPLEQRASGRDDLARRSAVIEALRGELPFLDDALAGVGDLCPRNWQRSSLSTS
jgi:hypothetical protein